MIKSGSTTVFVSLHVYNRTFHAVPVTNYCIFASTMIDCDLGQLCCLYLVEQCLKTTLKILPLTFVLPQGCTQTNRTHCLAQLVCLL